MYDLLNREDDTILFEKLKKTETFAREIMQEMAVKSKGRHANLKLMKGNFHKTDKFVKDILSNEMMNIRTNHVDIIENRFQDNLERIVGDNIKMNLIKIYTVFCKYANNKQSGIDVEKFKRTVKSMRDSDFIIKGTCLCITNYENKNIEVMNYRQVVTV